MKKHLIKNVKKGSIAEELGIKKGWLLTLVNDTEIKDILDYKYQMFDEYVVITIEDDNGEEWDYEIEKEENEDIGLVFEEELMDKARSCANKCIFCFMDQLPPDVRETLIFKDDDFRLSFMTGNYVTFTNCSYSDLERIVKYHLSPINVSVHATNPAVRCMMLNNRFAGKILEYIKYLTDNGIYINTQVVLCPKINDGKILDQTIKELSAFYPYMQCIAIVPVGISKHRDGLYKLTPFDKEIANKAIDQVEKWQEKFMKKYGSHIVYIADEVYVLAGRKIPSYESYEDFPQLEDGIGMMAKFEHEFDLKFAKLKDKNIKKTISIATGKCAYGFIKKLAKKLENRYKGLSINVYAIRNDYFGEKITVSGLITATDMIKQLKNKGLGDYLLINYNCLKSDSPTFLDNLTVKDVEKALKTKIKVTNGTGEDFIKKIIM